MEERSKCEICGSDAKLTKHHLIPQLKCKNKYKQLKDDESNHIWICETCHRTIHAYFSETELRDSFNTIDKLLSNDRFKKYVEWKKKHPDFDGGCTKMSNQRKNR